MSGQEERRLNPHEQKLLRHVEDAWRYGMGRAQSRRPANPLWSSSCCGAEVAGSQAVGIHCKKCGKRQK